MHARLFLALALAASADHSAAAINRSQKPAPGPAPAAAFPDYTTVTLQNGLKVFVIEDDRKPAVTFRLIIKGGSLHDGEKPGLSDLVASLLNRGTKRRDALTFAKESDFIGSRLEAISGPDSLAVSAGGLTKYTVQIVDLLVDAVVNPVFPQDQFAREQKKALSQLAAEKQQPSALASKLAGRVVYGPHPYGAVTTEESLKATTREDVVAYHKNWFSPQNATLAVVGDVKPADIVPLLEKAFAVWSQHEVPVAKVAEPPKMSGVTIHLIDRAGSVQSNIVVCQPGPARSGPDTPELNVMNATLGGGFSGRLFQNLREKHGWTYGAYSAFDMRRFGGAFQASAETRNEVTAPAIKETLAEMRRLREEAVPDQELELQRQYNVGNYLLSLENAARTAQRVQDLDLYGLPADFYKRYAARMSSVTPSQLQALAKSHLDLENTAIVVVGEAKQIAPELEKLGNVIVYDTALKPLPAPK